MDDNAQKRIIELEGALHDIKCQLIADGAYNDAGNAYLYNKIQRALHEPERYHAEVERRTDFRGRVAIDCRAFPTSMHFEFEDAVKDYLSRVKDEEETIDPPPEIIGKDGTRFSLEECKCVSNGKWMWHYVREATEAAE